ITPALASEPAIEPAIDIHPEPVVVKQSSTVPAAVPKQPALAAKSEAKVTSDCPVPIEAGEVAPFALPLSEWNPYGEGMQGEEGHVQQETIAETDVPMTPAPEAVQPFQEMINPPIIDTTPAPMEPTFGQASEYDFDFSDEKKIEKEVVIPEQDTMKDALKALGWEEEDSN
nr:hypothetical protein [Candidatus Sigynarchaeota archaeon]